MKIIVDAFGGDNAPLEIIKGSAMAVEEYNLDIVLVGSKEIIEKVAAENNISLKRMEIIDVQQVITMEDAPTDVIKSKKNCTMAEGFKLVASGYGDAFVSAGNSGAMVVGATMYVKRIKGVKRCAFAPVIPNSNGCFMLIDSGANVDCRPEMLTQFGIMGSIYMNKVMNINNPRVGLANVGTEEHKGGELQQEAFLQLKESNLNFVGNLEARDIPLDGAEVVVADGFTGNIILKMYEGVAVMLLGMFKGALTQNLKAKIAASMILPEMRQLKKKIDYNEYGGAPIIGISKPVFKAHGNSKALTFKNAIRLASEYVNKDVVGEITKAFAKDK